MQMCHVCMLQRCNMLRQKCVDWQRCMQTWLAGLVLRGGSGCWVGCVAMCQSPAWLLAASLALCGCFQGWCVRYRQCLYIASLMHPRAGSGSAAHVFAQVLS